MDNFWFHLPFISHLVSEGGRTQVAGVLDWASGAGLLLPARGINPSGPGNIVRKL